MNDLPQPNFQLAPLQVSHWPTRMIGLVATIAFTFFAVITFRPPQFFPTIVLFAFAAYSLFMFLSFGATSMDNFRIIQRSNLGEFELNWAEVKIIETDLLGNIIVFKGGGKQLVVPGFAFWAGKDKSEMVRLFQKQVRENHIPLQIAPLAAFAVSRNTRVE